ncbi:4-(cytidine 5'-diphospho)-2-C-methyl-D-erythritol kinase [Epibacterium sp. SM1979]|uniref:4-diphosphocytidyl-2-C-methyl-D-erythritol kinase n=1 Tax=Tritonibacter litoralis TaxID=2662264 RepID=A0A843YBT5_9RHOB|nr:4-(cytidine 5'-diphospho)-2-C-methyl-D-erythritol kinase [Tritonibacter litoralis]MQQ08760.1 4-(cytidine 5'-diphospho)-2-C-methyl-D-erythritol kinase [Tritonibacter litoralis]
MAEAFAPAKVNLSLHVVGQRADGYHLLDSLVVFADIGDRVRVEPRPSGSGLSLTVTGPLAAGVPTGPENLVIKAAKLAGVRDAAITLDKHLPAEAGIGGGSSDAAATLRAIQTALDVPIPKGLEQLGADVPVCAVAQAARMEGTGERVTALPRFTPLSAVLANPRVAVATPPVFKALSAKDNAPMPAELPDFAAPFDLLEWLQNTRNDLQDAACGLHSAIGATLDALSALEGARLVRMSGSGATCFALFANRTAAEEAARVLQQREPNWWVEACTLS